MALIAVHGATLGHLGVGLCGAAVSLVAKGFWTVLMRSTGVEMDDATQQWINAERADVNARLAVTAARRQLARTETRAADERHALEAGSGGSVTDIEWTAPKADGLTEQRLQSALEDSVRPGSGSADQSGSAARIPDPRGSGSTVKDAVRALYEAGTTDPGAIVKAVQADRPDANPETVRRMVRLVRTEGGYA